MTPVCYTRVGDWLLLCYFCLNKWRCRQDSNLREKSQLIGFETFFWGCGRGGGSSLWCTAIRGGDGVGSIYHGRVLPQRAGVGVVATIVATYD